jgi:hypothetical protein
MDCEPIASVDWQKELAKGGVDKRFGIRLCKLFFFSRRSVPFTGFPKKMSI